MNPPRQSKRSETTSASLIEGVRAMDEDCWQRFIDLYGPLIYYWCRQSGISDEDSRDLVQQVFSKVLSGIRRFRLDRDGATFRGWLWTITRNALNDFVRARPSRGRGEGGTEAQQRVQQIADPYVDPTTITSASGPSDLVRRAFDLIRGDFGDTALKAFQLVVFEGYSSREAGRQLGMTADAVRQAKSRILRRLREELGEAHPV
jgi:RNA polymerase sigma-70 factor (ECF subfamily)